MDEETQTTLVRRLCDKIRKNKEKITRSEEFLLEDADVVIIAYGTPARSARAAVRAARKRGVKAGLLRLITLWPFPENVVKKVAKKAKHIVVCEMNYGQMVKEVMRYCTEDKISFLPKLGEYPPTIDEILQVITQK
ncbi:hypothetical protein DRN94_002780 [archaeon]|nr:hypothetical protein [archaeon]